MLKVYHSNALDTLRDILVEMIRQAPLSDPFCREQILVQSPGMAQWLKLELAERLSIAANIDFPLPASFLWRTFSALLVDVPERSAYSKDSMTWALMRILPDYLSDPDFSALEHYLEEDQSPLRLYQLCAKVADLFDQYLVYRPDWIAQWDQGENSPAEEEQQWQPVLWRALVADTLERNLPHWHRANMFDAFITAIMEAPAESIPERVFVFGISALPQNYVQALVTLGKRCDIHLMVANPCRQFWSDIVDTRYLVKLSREAAKSGSDQSQVALYEQGNPLLASMGKLGRDYLYTLQQMELPEVQLFAEDDNRSLLKALQSDILSLRNRSANLSYQESAVSGNAPRLGVTSTDQSIQLHNCHSPMREIEVLQDQLLHIFETHQDLQPRDIIVMMPDVAVYSPFIDAVFGQAQGARYLPFSISDRNAQQESPLLANFLSLLNIIMGRFNVTDVLDLLALPAVLRRFDLDEQSFESLRHWVVSSGIKWGIDADGREALELPPFLENSWQFGLDRMFAGYSLGDISGTWQGIAPYAEVAGLEAVSLGQLNQFIRLLQRSKQQFNEAVYIDDWIAQINQLIQDLYKPDDLDLAALETIYSALEALQTTLKEVFYTDKVDAAIIMDYLQQGLQEQQSGQRFLSGQINFCTLMPMRAIPFQVVCLLGMNDGDYPRSIAPMGFDLMVDYPRKGDRSRRDDDRYLFLEALLSTRKLLYISYVGRSIIDNTERAPSVLVSELFEYCQQAYFVDDGAVSLQQHPLQDLPLDVMEAFLLLAQESKVLMAQLQTEHLLTPYHKQYFDQSDDKLFSYAEQWLSIANRDSNENRLDSFLQPLPMAAVPLLLLKDLVAFYRHPIKYFFQHKLRVQFIDDEVLLEDEEPFCLSGLDNYLMREKLLNYAHLDKGIEDYCAWVSASGDLPVGVAGHKSLAKNLKDAQDLAEKLKPLTQGDIKRLAFDIMLGQTQFQGWIEPLYDKGVVKYSAANSSGRSYITTWVEHLAACATGCQHTTYFRAINEQFHFTAVAPDSAQAYLIQLIQVYQQGLTQPLSWLPDLAWTLHHSEDKDKARESLQANYNKFSDPYLQRAYPQWHQIEKGIPELSEVILVPLVQSLVIDSDKGDGE